MAAISTMDEVRRYPWPSPDIFDFNGLELLCRKHHDHYAVIFGGPGIMDLINGVSFARGMEQVLVDIALEDPVGLALMERRQEIFLEVAERALKAANGLIDVLWIGDDYGTQIGPLMNTETWKKLFGPKLRAFIDLGHKYGAKVMLHSCGSNRNLVPIWIDMGLDIYQAVQVEAEGMDAAGLFRDFGGHITFHGMVGLQSVLAHGTPEEVRAQVNAIAKHSGGSGWIVAPTHFFDHMDAPIENACAIYEAVKQQEAVF
jgi:uroporphyrinogen decarboxylase